MTTQRGGQGGRCRMVYPLSARTLLVPLDTGLVMHDIISNKMCSIVHVQVTQKTLSFVIFSTISFVTWNGFSKATNRKQFLVTFSQKYVLQIYKNVMKVKKNHSKNKHQC